MNQVKLAFETSCLLAEKVASARPASNELREKLALADFAAFGLFKRGGLDPAMLSSLQKGLGWGVGLGLPALGVGHMLAHDARHQGEKLVRDARNQALLTAAGVGGMQALGNLLKRAPQPQQHNINVSMPHDLQAVQAAHMLSPKDPDLSAMSNAISDSQKIAAAIMVDDVLEAAHDECDLATKYAALVRLVIHRGEAMELVRGWLT